jgi:hypothetical protein
VPVVSGYLDHDLLDQLMTTLTGPARPGEQRLIRLDRDRLRDLIITHAVALVRIRAANSAKCLLLCRRQPEVQRNSPQPAAGNGYHVRSFHAACHTEDLLLVFNEALSHACTIDIAASQAESSRRGPIDHVCF